MTSVGRETGRAETLASLRDHVAAEFARAHDRRPRAVAPARLSQALATPVG
jgi:hypothetical protein